MLTVNKFNLFFTYADSSPLSLSSLSGNSNISQLLEVSPTGRSMRIWTPSATISSFTQLAQNKTYYLRSNSVSYNLNINSGNPAQASYIVGKYQFFTFTGASSYALSSLPTKSKIIKIYKPSTSGTAIQSWTPSSSFPPFNTFAPSTTYLIVSNTTSYDLFT